MRRGFATTHPPIYLKRNPIQNLLKIKTFSPKCPHMDLALRLVLYYTSDKVDLMKYSEYYRKGVLFKDKLGRQGVLTMIKLQSINITF
jgi:hypothetical protein